MSSLNDGSGSPTSKNDSIPLDEESSVSIYSNEEQEGEYERSDMLSNVSHSSIDYSSVSRTYLSQSHSRGAVPQSEDYTGTASYYSNGENGGGAGSNSYGYDDEDYEYSSGYDSLSYGDTSLRSPHSELSSTFASFYYENEFVVKMRSTLHFLRRPLYFFAFATAGSGAVGSVFRLATTMVKRRLDSGAGAVADASLGAVPGSAGGVLSRLGANAVAQLPSGYPDVPAWLQEVRASLPSVMEVSATWLLRRNNIPVLSDLVKEQLVHQQQQQQQQQAMAAAATGLAAHVSSGVQAAWQSWRNADPAIPVSLFLPLFSIAAIKVAQHVRPSPQNVTELLRAQQDAEDAEVASAYLSTASPARPMSVNASPIAASPAAAPSSSAGNTSVQSSIADVPPTLRGGGGSGGTSASPSQPSPPVPPVSIPRATKAPLTGVGGADGAAPSPGARLPSSAGDGRTAALDNVTPASQERSRSTTQAPQTYRHVAEEAVEDIDVDTGLRLPSLSPPSETAGEGTTAAAAVGYDVAAKPPSPLPQPPFVAIGSSNATTATTAAAATTTTTTMSGAQAASGGLTRGSTLRGDVVAAVAGAPDVREANIALLAAARYGCTAVLLPASLATADGILATPPSLEVAFVNDVVVSAMNYADRHGLTLLGVTAQRYDAAAQPLDAFTHPLNALYLFVSHEASNPAAVAAMAAVVLRSIYVGTSRRELPANQVFYDRLLKERTAS